MTSDSKMKERPQDSAASLTDCGVLYLASGDQFVAEARTSARSIAENMAEIETAIATPDTHLDLSIFDRIIEWEAKTKVVDGREWLINSTIPPMLSPYEKTLYLDSDTYVYADVTELFDLLDRFDMAIARNSYKNEIKGLPDPWWEYNCGVIAYRNTPAIQEFLKDWERRYLNRIEKQVEPEDQPAFAHALYNSDLDFYTLPHEYNVRCDRRGSLGREAKIVHGRHRAGIDTVAEELNQVKHLRVFRENSYLTSPTIKVKGHGTYRYHLERTILEDGIGMVLKRAGAHTLDQIFGTDLVDRTYEDRNNGE